MPVDWLSQALAGLRPGSDAVPLLDENAATSLAQGLRKVLAKADPWRPTMRFAVARTG
ncbi:hypothetical protein [Noviherbaspirillum sp.]|uniref:hypothetical protein n=1 Tax=Noviherbaspirillum sp. TaxID=1926288 RepID=UPI002B473A30|nr:hypothetical protein [Noviherbaspirillum sp.]HJV80424.1 hypothetical protein [Noviherbaspirillum sp.]